MGVRCISPSMPLASLRLPIGRIGLYIPANEMSRWKVSCNQFPEVKRGRNCLLFCAGLQVCFDEETTPNVPAVWI